MKRGIDKIKEFWKRINTPKLPEGRGENIENNTTAISNKKEEKVLPWQLSKEEEKAFRESEKTILANNNKTNEKNKSNEMER